MTNRGKLKWSFSQKPNQTPLWWHISNVKPRWLLTRHHFGFGHEYRWIDHYFSLLWRKKIMWVSYSFNQGWAAVGRIRQTTDHSYLKHKVPVSSRCLAVISWQRLAWMPFYSNGQAGYLTVFGLDFDVRGSSFVSWWLVERNLVCCI